MKRILLIAFCLVCIVGPASAYGLYLDCPQAIQVGLPLKCSIDSDLPAGNTFDLVMYRSQYTATELSRQSVTIQEDKNTQYRLFETQGLPGGMYKIEIQLKGTRGEESLRSDSVTFRLINILDRSGEITITSPETQTLEEALRIEGTIDKLGNDGVQIEVRGPEGRIFGPQYIGTKTDVKNDAGIFTYRMTVAGPGIYEVAFGDSKGYIGIKKFTVAEPPTPEPTPEPTTVPTTVPATTRPPTTVPTPLPATTQSPLSPVLVTGALGIGGVLMAAASMRKK
ncbi:MAG: hypothetical protein LUO98_04195 [Methanoregula sp.]|nr:hypothetical protein [Methanoregula sp.]